MQIVQLHSNFAVIQCRIKPAFVEEIKSDVLDANSVFVIAPELRGQKLKFSRD